MNDRFKVRWPEVVLYFLLVALAAVLVRGFLAALEVLTRCAS